MTATRRATSSAPSASQASSLPTPEQLLDLVRNAADDLKARDLFDIDVRGRTGITDFMVIASGTSNRHVKSIADEIVKQAKQAGIMPLGVEGEREGEWILVDLGDVLVHVMLPRTREFYGLERLWSVDSAHRGELAVEHSADDGTSDTVVDDADTSLTH